MAEPTHIVHGCPFIRTGKCIPCKGCFPECSTCPHGDVQGDKVLCKIQDTKGQLCKFCTENESSQWYRKGKPVYHQICVDFPNHPWLNVIKSGVCSYKFEEVKEEGAESLYDKLTTEFEQARIK